MTEKSYLIGVDLGTAGTKAAIFDEKGNLIADAYQESKFFYPRPGWVEQEMDDFYSSACRAIREIMERSKIAPRRIAAMAFDGQMGGLGGIDENWKPLTRYDSWLDTRCEPYIELMKEKAGDLVLAKSGAPPSYNHGPRILWWKNEAPEVFAKIRKFVMPAGYVAGKMANLKGEKAFIDYTYLNFGGFSDTEKACWSEELCQIFGVPGEKLPHITTPWKIIGKVSSQAARDTHLVSGIPIAAGAGDQMAGFLGAGLVEKGQLIDVAGTASCFAGCISHFTPEVKTKTFFCFRSVIPGLWYLLAYINGGGLCLKWFRDQFARREQKEAQDQGIDTYQVLNREAQKISPGSEGLIFTPHLGGRVCPYNPDVKGSWFGFNWKHTKSHFYRAILEGIAYEYAYYFDILNELFPHLPFEKVRVIGGGAKSSLWNQIKADVLNLSYLRVNREELPVLGSAIIAGYAVGLFSDLASTSKKFTTTVAPSINPSLSRHNYYHNFSEAYLKLLSSQEGPARELTRISQLPRPD